MGLLSLPNGEVKAVINGKLELVVCTDSISKKEVKEWAEYYKAEQLFFNGKKVWDKGKVLI